MVWTFFCTYACVPVCLQNPPPLPINAGFMGKRELVALLNLSSWCPVMALPRGAIGLSAVCDCGIS